MSNSYIITVYYSDKMDIKVDADTCEEAEKAAFSFLAKDKPKCTLDAYDCVCLDEDIMHLSYDKHIRKRDWYEIKNYII